MTIVLNTETIRLLTLFEKMTNVQVIDCFMGDGVVYYVVEEGKIGLAIGKNGNSIKKVEKAVGKRVKVFEYSSNPAEFIQKIIPQCKGVEIKEDVIEIKVNKKDKGLVIGRGGEKIKIFKEILKRTHNIPEIKVK